MRIIFAGAPRRLAGGAGILAALAFAMLASACSDSLTGSTVRPGGPLAGTGFQLEGVEVTACQYGGEYPNCKSAPIDDGYNPNLPPSGTTGTTAGGDGGGGGSTTGTTTPPPDTTKPCTTGDAALDSKEVQEGMNQVWTESNPLAAQADRRERVGWIVLNNGSYTFVAIPIASTNATPCSVDWIAAVPAGAVAWVHTHPFNRGEQITGCGLPRAGYYPGGPSDTDKKTSDSLGLAGYVMDAQGVYRFGGVKSSTQKMTCI